MKKIILTFLLSIIYVAVSAQRLGFIGGYQLTTPFPIVAGKVIDFNEKAGSGFHVGGYFDWEFHKRYGLDFQLLYAMRSNTFDIHYLSDTTTHFVRNTFNLEIPIHIYANLRIKKEFILAPFLGPSFNIGLHGKDIAWQNTDLQKPVDLQTKNLYGKDNRMNRFEIAGEAGIMMKYKNYGVRASYSVGLTNLITQNYAFTTTLPSGSSNKKNYNKYLYDGVFKLSFVYVFDLRK